MTEYTFAVYGELTATEQFDAAIRRVNDQRGQAYGHALDNFRRQGAGMAVIDECTDPEVRVALHAIWGKVCRLIHSPDHLDSAIDVAGYARTICMVIDERARRAERELVGGKGE